MSEPFIGEVRAVSWNLVPKGWAQCNGQLLSIQQNQALFSILGTTYGGDGINNFALPNLQGRVAVHAGGEVQLGESAGTTSVTLTQSDMPTHNHPLQATEQPGNESLPGDMMLASAPVYAAANPNTTLAPQTVGPAGGSQPHDNMQPYLVINYLIAVYGIFPSRS